MLSHPTQLDTLLADTYIHDDRDGRVDSCQHTPPNAHYKPAIYETDRKPCDQHSMIGPALIHIILTKGTGCLLGNGNNIWNVLPMSDVSVLLILLVEAAVKGVGKLEWAHDVCYFCKADEMSQR